MLAVMAGNVPGSDVAMSSSATLPPLIAASCLKPHSQLLSDPHPLTTHLVNSGKESTLDLGPSSSLTSRAWSAVSVPAGEQPGARLIQPPTQSPGLQSLLDKPGHTTPS